MQYWSKCMEQQFLHTPKKFSTEVQNQGFLIALFDRNGMIYQDFVPQGQTVNADFHETVLRRLLSQIRCIRSQIHRSEKWSLLHDVAHPNAAIRVHNFIAQHRVIVITRP